MSFFTATTQRTQRLRNVAVFLAYVASWRWTALAFLLFAYASSAQRSPFNFLQVEVTGNTGHYRILIGGHFHGASTNKSGYPAATLLANLDTINSLGANLFLSTGDLFMDPVKDWPRYERSLFSKLKIPLFNAPGNHDLGSDDVPIVDGRVEYAIGNICELIEAPENPFGPPVVVLLNTEVNEGTFSDAQLEELLEASNAPEGCVFIISHRPIWAEDDPQYSPLFEGNTRSLTGTNFKSDVYPLLEKIAEHAHVYWISGSMGGQAPASIFFQQHAKNITYIQCAIRDEPRDALLIADVYPDTVKWSALSLTGQELLAPEAYNAEWWRERLGKSEGFNWRLLPYLVKVTVTHRAFWWGAGSVALLWLLLARLRRARS